MYLDDSAPLTTIIKWAAESERNRTSFEDDSH